MSRPEAASPQTSSKAFSLVESHQPAQSERVVDELERGDAVLGIFERKGNLELPGPEPELRERPVLQISVDQTRLGELELNLVVELGNDVAREAEPRPLDEELRRSVGILVTRLQEPRNLGQMRANLIPCRRGFDGIGLRGRQLPGRPVGR